MQTDVVRVYVHVCVCARLACQMGERLGASPVMRYDGDEVHQHRKGT